MEGHTRLLWLTCGGLATIGVVVPLAMSHTPENVPLIQALRAMGGVGFMAGLIAMLRFTGATAPVGDIIYETPPPAPSAFEDDPLAAGAGRTPLEQRIDAAIEASGRYARTAGVIYYNLDSYRQIARSKGVKAADATLDEIVDKLRARLRACDRIERLHKGRFIVCSVLLSDRQALLAVRDTLNATLRGMRVGASPSGAVEFDEGLSLYPICGDSGANLIAHAKKQSDAAYARRLRAVARTRKRSVDGRRAA